VVREAGSPGVEAGRADETLTAAAVASDDADLLSPGSGADAGCAGTVAALSADALGNSHPFGPGSQPWGV
jgi:hypothetical protein